MLAGFSWIDSGYSPASSLVTVEPSGLVHAVRAVYVPDRDRNVSPSLVVPVRPFRALARAHHDAVVVAADGEKEDLLLHALPHINGVPTIIVVGYGHLEFRDQLFHEVGQLLVPSLANGYPLGSNGLADSPFILAGFDLL
jgi:hypothetical protein